MDPANQASFWAPLVPLLSAILGGLIGSLSGQGAQYLNHTLARNKEKEQKRADRFAALVDLILEHDHWLERMRLWRVFDEARVDTPAPIERATIMVASFYPELRSSFGELRLASSRYQDWQAQTWQKRTSGPTDLNEGFTPVYREYLAKYSAFRADLAEYAQNKLSA